MSNGEYVVGQIVVLQDEIRDPSTGDGPDGDPDTWTLVDDSSDALTVYKPDGTPLAPTVSRASLGTYTAQVTVDQAGYWTYYFNSTGSGAGAKKKVFYVSPVP